MPQVHCSIVTPEATVSEGDYDFVVLPLFDGELGVAPGRAPLIGRLGYGELRLRSGSTVSRFYVDGGFVQVADDNISVLTGSAVAGQKLDAAELEESLAAARGTKTHSEEEVLARERSVARTRAQLTVAKRAGDR